MERKNVTVNFVKMYSVPFGKELSAIELILFSILFEKAKTTPENKVSLSYQRLLKIIPFKTNICTVRNALRKLQKKKLITLIKTGRGKGVTCVYGVNISNVSEMIRKYQELANVCKIL